MAIAFITNVLLILVWSLGYDNVIVFLLENPSARPRSKKPEFPGYSALQGGRLRVVPGGESFQVPRPHNFQY